MKTRASFLLWCLLLLTPLWAGASSNCTDWFLVTVDSRTGEVLHRKYLYTTCDNCFNMCLEEDAGGGSGNNDEYEITNYFDPTSCSQSHGFLLVSSAVCEFSIDGEVPWLGPSQWAPKLVRANLTDLTCGIWNSSIQVEDNGSRAVPNKSRNFLSVLFDGSLSYVVEVTMFGVPIGIDSHYDDIYEAKYFYDLPDGCF